MNTNEKVQICKVVAQAILADGQVTDTEHDFITGLMDKYELTDEQKGEVMARNIDDDPAALVEGIEAFDSKNQLMVELVMAVAADEELSPSERDLLSSVAESIGVSKEEWEMLVKTALM